MHYNYFTIDYIKAIKKTLKIEIDNDGNPIFLPDSIEDSDIDNLKSQLNFIWKDSNSAISIIEEKKDATIQSGLFGLIDDLDTALKIGFLMGDRVVLIDYLFERLLKKDSKDINRTHLGSIANSLVSALHLAEKGRIVIIPNPFNWFSLSKKVITEVSTKTLLSLDLISLLNMLSITKRCKLHPYTIAESENNYNAIIDNQLDQVDTIGRDGGKYAYEGILGALLSEKLLNKTDLKTILNVPLSKYYEIISANKDFYLNYLNEITKGGSLSADNNIDIIKNKIVKSIKERNKKYISASAKAMTIGGSIGSGAIGVLAVTSVISAPIAITGAILSLSATLTGLVNGKKNEELIISVFNNLYDNK